MSRKTLSPAQIARDEAAAAAFAAFKADKAAHEAAQRAAYAKRFPNSKGSNALIDAIFGVKAE
jgi:hypothetical protein